MLRGQINIKPPSSLLKNGIFRNASPQSLPTPSSDSPAVNHYAAQKSILTSTSPDTHSSHPTKMHLTNSLILIPLLLTIQQTHAVPLDTSPNNKHSPLLPRQVQCTTIGCISNSAYARTCVRQGCAQACGPNGFCTDPPSDSSSQTNFNTGSDSETCDASSEFCPAEPNTTAQCSGGACDPGDAASCGGGCTCRGFFTDTSLTGRDTTYSCVA